MKRRMFFSIIFFLLLLIFITPAIAQQDQMDQQMAGETKVVDGISGRFKVTPSMNMLDLYLTDKKTNKVITQAKARVNVISPDGIKIEKELAGMKMGEVYSFMNNLDMSMKGKYKFDITVESGKKKVTFPFAYEVK